MTDKLELFRLGYSAGIFSQMNEVTLSCQVKQPIVFVIRDKIWTQEKFKFWKTSIFHYELDLFTRLQDFPGETSGEINHQCDIFVNV